MVSSLLFGVGVSDDVVEAGDDVVEVGDDVVEVGDDVVEVGEVGVVEVGDVEDDSESTLVTSVV